MTEAMPRKTRKEKLRATQRLAHTDQSFVFTYSQQKNIHLNSPQNIHMNYVRSDIIKTVLLGSLFIVFEIGLAVISKKIGW